MVTLLREPPPKISSNISSTSLHLDFDASGFELSLELLGQGWGRCDNSTLASNCKASCLKALDQELGLFYPSFLDDLLGPSVDLGNVVHESLDLHRSKLLVHVGEDIIENASCKQNGPPTSSKN